MPCDTPATFETVRLSTWIPATAVRCSHCSHEQQDVLNGAVSRGAGGGGEGVGCGNGALLAGCCPATKVLCLERPAANGCCTGAPGTAANNPHAALRALPMPIGGSVQTRSPAMQIDLAARAVGLSPPPGA